MNSDYKFYRSTADAIRLFLELDVIINRSESQNRLYNDLSKIKLDGKYLTEHPISELQSVYEELNSKAIELKHKTVN